MIPSLKLKALADSHAVLEGQLSQAKCSVCQEFYGNGWMGRRAHRQTSYLRELIQDIVSLSQIILSQIRGGFRVRTFADPYGDQRRGLKCGAGTCQYPMCEACWSETMESCPQCRRVPNPYGRRTKRWGTLKPHPSTPHLPSSFFSYTDTPTVALIPPVGKIRLLVFRQNAHKLCQPDC